MTAQLTDYQTDPVKQAQKLYVMARKMEKQQNYEAAREYYRQSLALYEDEIVKVAYFNLLATIGPM